MFQHLGNGATIKGKNMLHIWGIFFPLREAAKIKLHQYVSLLKSTIFDTHFDVANIKRFADLVYRYIFASWKSLK